jgi:uncharacterized heparinase superfamily protein
MGYLRLEGATATAIIDAALPPAGRHAAAAHASALAFELWLGRQPVIVSCGSGLGFGAGAAAAGRRAGAHSGLRMEPAPAGAPRSRLFSRAGVTARLAGQSGTVSAALESRMDVAGMGLVLNRHVELARDGTWLSGVDVAHSATMAMRKRASAAFRGAEPALVARFHIHPEVRAALALNGRAVALTLPGGARWLMQVDADGLALSPSVYYDETRARPRATVQVVARRALVAYRSRIVWSLEPMDLGAPRAVPGPEAAAIRA